MKTPAPAVTGGTPRVGGADRGLQRALPPWLRSERAFRAFALGSVISNVVIVVSGGAVRLTGSGLGCPTWPKCTDDSLVPTSEYAFHGIIEFTNRQITFVVGFFAIATWIIALARRQHRGLALAVVLSIPAQAVLGGLTVLTHLNPWLVAGHFMLSIAIIFVTAWLWWRVRGAPVPLAVPYPVLVLARVTVLVALAALVLGTVVTGAGPHAGDANESGKVNRIAFKVSSLAQLHADSVWILVGVTVGLVAVAYAVHADAVLRNAAWTLLGVEMLQGAIGYTQYFLHVPPLLVGLHMLGACLLWLAALLVLALVEPHAAGRSRAASEQVRQAVDREPGQRADHGAVDTDELQVATDL